MRADVRGKLETALFVHLSSAKLFSEQWRDRVDRPSLDALFRAGLNILECQIEIDRSRNFRDVLRITTWGDAKWHHTKCCLGNKWQTDVKDVP